MTTRVVPWAIYDGSGALKYLALALNPDHVWTAFLAYLGPGGQIKEDYTNQGWQCVRCSVKRLNQ